MRTGGIPQSAVAVLASALGCANIWGFDDVKVRSNGTGGTGSAGNTFGGSDPRGGTGGALNPTVVSGGSKEIGANGGSADAVGGASGEGGGPEGPDAGGASVGGATLDGSGMGGVLAAIASGGRSSGVGGNQNPGYGGNASGGSVANSGGMNSAGGRTHSGGDGTLGGGPPQTGGQTAVGGAPNSRPASCRLLGPGLSDCGASAEDCCASTDIPSGSYYRTYSNDGTGPTGEADLASISAFRLDKYEVTVGRFRQFAKALKTGWIPTDGSGKHTHLNHGLGLSNSGSGGFEPGWQPADNVNLSATETEWLCNSGFATWKPSASTADSAPMNCVNSWEAQAFCIWDGGFLPSEAEWEYAAAGGAQQRMYPWGSTEPGMSFMYAIYSCYYPDISGPANCVTAIAPVGTASLGISRWGQLDLAGNLNEWIADWHGPYKACVDCASMDQATTRVIRGGDFFDNTDFLKPPNRNVSRAPETREYYLGFRCARSPN